MSRYRFVDPDTDTLPMSDGDWIEVKKYLTAGEDKKLKGAGVTRMTPDAEGKSAFDLDFERLGLARLQVYIVAWSFADKKGRQVKVTREFIASLDVETVAEIDKLLDAHIEKMEKEKNEPKPEPSVETTSPSASS